jgi:hypothetical protein
MTREKREFRKFQHTGRLLTASGLWCLALILSSSCSLSTGRGGDHNTADLQVPRLIKALPVEGHPACEPSGLIIFQERLFAVSDHHDDLIFEILIEDDRAVFTPFLEFRAPPLPATPRLDFEGITCDDEGNFYLVSERALRILRVERDGSRSRWITPSLKQYGEKSGLFTITNGGLEGIAFVGPGHFFLCAERQARGILKVFTEPLTFHARAWNCDEGETPSHPTRPPDFSDLYYEKGVLYALGRGTEWIARIEVTESGVCLETPLWSLAPILSDPRYDYIDSTYGQAEGFCMDADRLYVILDNNGQARKAAPEDNRPLLFIFERPS